MKSSRSAFLAATALGTVAPSLVAASTPGQVADAVRGQTFAMLRDGNVDHLGIRVARGIIDVAAAATAMGIAGLPTTTDDVIAGRGDVVALARIAASAPDSAIRSESSVQYAPVVGSPGKIVCVGLNYRAHVAEFHGNVTSSPELFNKFNSSLNRHNGTIPVSTMDARHFDYESELVAVIGKTAKNVSESQALAHVFGYAAGNDFTARDLQHRVTQWMTGKTPDHFAPIGPWLVTADQIPDPQSLQVRTYVNDETVPRQDMNTAQMIFSVATLVSYTSRFITLSPGDIIFTGTPSGVIDGYPAEKQVWLKAGDRVRTSIDKVGDLRFTLV